MVGKFDKPPLHALVVEIKTSLRYVCALKQITVIKLIVYFCLPWAIVAMVNHVTTRLFFFCIFTRSLCQRKVASANAFAQL